MENSGLTASDIALMNRDGGFGDGWGGFMWIFALLILAGGGFGGFGGYGANSAMLGNMATQNDVQRGFDNQNLQAQTRDILTAVTTGTAEGIAATNQTFHDTLGIVQNRYDELARDISGLAVGQANLLAKQNECCCETKMLIQQNNYDGAIRDAQTNANFTAQIQGVKDMIAQNKIEALQSKVNALELQNAVAGVVRYPNALTYSAGASPFCGCGAM